MNCLRVLHIISLYGALSLHNPADLQVHFSLCVRQNNRRYCTLKTITQTYYKNYNFIAKPIVHRPDMLTTHICGYKNHMLLDNTIIIKGIYISNNIAGI